MVRTSDGRGDLVMAYGSAWTDGDTVALNTTTFTYQGTSPGALQFNSQASLITLINAAGSGAWIAADYGADYSPSVATGHIRIRRAVAGSAAWYVQVTTALPTAGMVLANGTGGNPLRCNSLGAEASGTGTQLVIWSPLATDNACLTLEPANASAAALIAANGYYVTNRGGADSGSAFVVQVGATAGTEIFRWAIT